MSFSISVQQVRLALLTLLCTATWTLQAQTQTGGVSASQYQALVDIYNASNGNGWFTNENWLTTEPVSTWYGVTVDTAGRVVQLDLSFINLTGKLPASIANLPLTSLAVTGNELTAIEALPATLLSLNADNNLLSKLPALPAGLRDLRVKSNKLIQITALPASLKLLEVSSNLLATLPAFQEGLLNLAFANNQVKSLPKLPSTLTSLNGSSNLLRNLPVLPASLTSLLISNNLLRRLPELPAMLKFLNTSGNKLVELPVLPASLNLIITPTNALNFDDLEPVITRFFSPGFYAPQANVGAAYTIQTPVRRNVWLSAQAAGSSANNRYIWFKNNVRISDTLTTPHLKLTQVDTSASGVYTCQITNTAVKGLVLQRNPITLSVMPAMCGLGTVAARLGANEPVAVATTSALSVRANPFVETIDLVTTATHANHTVKVVVMNLQGQVVYTANNHPIQKPIQLNQALPNTTYILHVTDGTQTHTFQLLKQN